MIFLYTFFSQKSASWFHNVFCVSLTSEKNVKHQEIRQPQRQVASLIVNLTLMFQIQFLAPFKHLNVLLLGKNNKPAAFKNFNMFTN